MTVYVQPGLEGAKVTFKTRYENWIGGKWVPPVKGQYFENVTPVTGKQFTEAAQGSPEDIELALDAAHLAAPAWGKTSPAERALILHRIGDRMMDNLEMLAVAETWDNGERTSSASIISSTMPPIVLYLRKKEPIFSRLDDHSNCCRLARTALASVLAAG